MADLPIGDIIRNITDDVKLLVQDQIELLRPELTPAAKLGGTGAGLFGVAGYFALSATIIFYFAAAFGLVAAGLAAWLRILIVGGALLLIAGICAGIGLMLGPQDQRPRANDRAGQPAVTEVQDAAQHALAAARAPQIEGQVVPAPRPLPERSG